MALIVATVFGIFDGGGFRSRNRCAGDYAAVDRTHDIASAAPAINLRFIWYDPVPIDETERRAFAYLPPGGATSNAALLIARRCVTSRVFWHDHAGHDSWQ